MREQFLSAKGSGILLTKTTIDNMEAYFETLLNISVPAEKTVLFSILSDYSCLVGKSFQQKWDEGDRVH